MSLRCLPYEVVAIITEHLDLEDIFHLAISCRQLQYLLDDNRRCKVFLSVSFLYPSQPHTEPAQS